MAEMRIQATSIMITASSSSGCIRMVGALVAYKPSTSKAFNGFGHDKVLNSVILKIFHKSVQMLSIYS